MVAEEVQVEDTTYDTKPEIMRLLGLFGEHKTYWSKEFGRLATCTYWRGYLLRHEDNQLFKDAQMYDRDGEEI